MCKCLNRVYTIAHTHEHTNAGMHERTIAHPHSVKIGIIVKMERRGKERRREERIG